MSIISLKTKTLIIAIFCGLLYSSAYAQTEAAPAQAGPVAAVTLIDQFFRAYKEDTRKAVKDLFKTNPLIDSGKVDDVIKTIDKERANLGKYNGKELIHSKKATASLVLYSYLVKHDVQPVRFTFMFYKPKNDWMIYRFYFDGNVETELQEAAKL